MDLINWISWHSDTAKVKNSKTTFKEQGGEPLTSL